MYCETCNKNICIFCEQEHEDHDIIRLGKLIMKEKDFENKTKKFKISLDKFKEDTKKMINILEKVLDNCERFYKIYEDFIHNFDLKNRNYHYLKNFKEFYNDDISKSLDNINSSKNYEQKITKIYKIYNLMYNNKLDINDKSGETKKLINGLNSKKLSPGEKMMRVIFITEDEKVQYVLICKNTDKFSDIEKKLYEMYPDYYNENNTFSVNGRAIDESKDLDYNKIKNGDIINLHGKEHNKIKKYLNKIFK
jgi:molybdopterin converting factor small subunit